MDFQNDNTRRITSAVSTALIMLIIVVICLSFGHMPPDPPIPESGVEVNLGYSDMGFGSNEMPADGGEVAQQAPATAANENISTQSSEESVALPNKQSNSKAEPTPQPTPATAKTEEKPKQPELNKNALFSGSKNKNKNNGGSEGNTTGSGNMGKANGNPNASGYTGNGGGGGNGTSYSLAGRSARTLPEPSYSSKAEGKIVVEVWVDRQGNVVATATGRGTTINDQSLINQALAAAKKAKFSASETAAEKQKGTITYVFRRTN